ncbi:hypothetical protein [Kutzneria chonburiensis]|uniref:HTH luxR-type domain-containing protein n=1 Tax=Kutzneria chonburiensis TaxID=1483604 RepID=A0ABV6N628_9PSEU|nr:hypothetical protein [Kutzneria chonburiensis]
MSAKEIARLVASGAPLVAVVGAAGAGHEVLLEQLRPALDRTLTVQCSPHPLGASLRALLSPLTQRGATPADPLRWTNAGLLAAASPIAAEHAAAAIVAALRRVDVHTLLIEDAHLLDDDSVAVLAAMAQLPDSGVTCVCVAELPATAARSTVQRLWRDGLARVLVLRPLGAADTVTAARVALQARPSAELVARLRQLSGGLAALLLEALNAVARGDAVSFAAGRAHLAGPVSATLPADHPLLATLRRDDWPVVKAIAVLHPLGDTLPATVAGALGTSQDAVLAVLDRLRSTGVLRRDGRFRAEMVAATITAQLGPFERRQLARAAVLAVWDGAVVDTAYYADRLAEAGRLVDRERACTELLKCAEAVGTERWLLAAADITADDRRRQRILVQYARECYQQRKYEESLRTAERVVRDGLPTEDLDTLTHITVLAGHARPAAGYLSRLLQAREHLMQGRRNRFEDDLDVVPESALGQWDRLHLRLLPALLGGDADVVDKVLADARGERLAPAHRAAVALVRGDVSTGEDLARRLGDASTDIAHTLVRHQTAVLALARGRLTLSRDLLRAPDTALPHLLDSAEARIDLAFGDHEQARARLREGLKRASDAVLETDRLWAQLAELAYRRGDIDGAMRCCREAERIARAADSPGALLRSLVARAIVERDLEIAAAAAGLATDRGQPLELADVVGRLAARGLVDPRALLHAYEALEELDALLSRARLRHLMREHGVAVPGRQQTLAENERLLAVLAADGLTNRQLATVLQATEKSVESRLSRLFTRSGYKSRVELAAAVHAGEYPR